MDTAQKRNRISREKAGFMIGVACFYDAFQFLLTTTFIGAFFTPLISVIAWLHFWLWFKLNGVSWSDSLRKIVLAFGVMLFESFPFLSAIPTWTISASLMVFIVRLEDRKFNSELRGTEASAFAAKQRQALATQTYAEAQNEAGRQENRTAQEQEAEQRTQGVFVRVATESVRTEEKKVQKEKEEQKEGWGRLLRETAPLTFGRPEHVPNPGRMRRGIPMFGARREIKDETPDISSLRRTVEAEHHSSQNRSEGGGQAREERETFRLKKKASFTVERERQSRKAAAAALHTNPETPAPYTIKDKLFERLIA